MYYYVTDIYDENKRKWVEVEEHVSLDGTIEPIAVYWDDGRIFEISKIISVEDYRKEPFWGSTLYTVRIEGREKNLFRFQDKWFVVEK